MKFLEGGRYETGDGPWDARCVWCDCRMEYDKKDITRKGERLSIQCPNCKGKIILPPHFGLED